MKKLLSCCPVVDKETVSLIPADFQFQPGKPLSAFDASIYWLQESESSVSLISSNQSTQYFGKYDDKDGYLTSLDQAYRLAKQINSTYDFSLDASDLLQVQIDIFQTPVFELFSQDIKFSWNKGTNWRQYESVADDWVEIQHPNQPISSKNVLRPMKRKVLLHQHTVFSSDLAADKHIETVQEFKKQWHVIASEQPRYSKNRK
ncbi:MAG: hypothetical protein ACI843_001037 [Psychrobacter glaciei]|jgi:hypothetical protein